MTNDLLTLKQAADLAGTSPAYLRVLIQRGKLPATKRIERGQTVNYVRRSDVEHWSREHAASAAREERQP